MPYTYRCPPCGVSARPRSTRADATADRADHHHRAHHGLRPNGDHIAHRRGLLGWIALGVLGVATTFTATVLVGGVLAWRSDPVRAVRATWAWQWTARAAGAAVFAACLALVVWAHAR